MKTIGLNYFKISNNSPIILIAGPCALESREHAEFMATELRDIADQLGIPFIFKTSYDKANRTSIDSPRGVGIEQAIPIFETIHRWMGIPVLTDVHEFWQCDAIKYVVDVIQIPAFLSRQTDLIAVAAGTGRIVNVKKGQFMSPQDITHVVRKIEASGGDEILLTDRGTSFGYNTLVSDMRSLPIMAETGYPIIFDATHSVQQPSGAGGKSSGQREFVFPLARAAVAVGVAGVFMEVHDDPDNAVSDGPNMLRLDEVGDVVAKLMEIDKVVKNG